MKNSRLTLLLLSFLLVSPGLAASRDSERLQALKDMIAKEEMRSKELTKRALRLEYEIGWPTYAITSAQTMRNLDNAVTTLQNAPTNYLLTKDMANYVFWVDYNKNNYARAYASVFSRWEAYNYIVSSHMQDQ